MDDAELLAEMSKNLQAAEKNLEAFTKLYGKAIKMVFTGDNPGMEKVMLRGAHMIIDGKSSIEGGHLNFNVAASCLDLPVPEGPGGKPD